MWAEIDKIVDFGLSENCDFCSFENSRSLKGTMTLLSNSCQNEVLTRPMNFPSAFEREHVYPFFFENTKNLNVKRVEVSERLKTRVKLDLDYPEDLDFFRKIA